MMDKSKLTICDSFSHPLTQNSSSISSQIFWNDAKSFQDAEKSWASADSDSPIHPLQIDLVAQKVLGFLDSKSLKNCRLVCKLWSVEGGKILLKSSFIRPQSHIEICNSKWHFLHRKKTKEKKMEVTNLVQFLNLTSNQKLNFVVQSCDLYPFLSSFPPEILSRIHQLRYERDDSLSAVTNLIEMLEHRKLLNLKMLETRALEPKFWTFPFPFFHLQFQFLFQNREQYFENLVEKLDQENQNNASVDNTDTNGNGGKFTSKNIKLRLTFSPLQKIYQYKNYTMKLSGFSKISINIGDRRRRVCQILFTPSKLKWPLTHAHLKLEGPGDRNSNSNPDPDSRNRHRYLNMDNFPRSFSRSEVISWLDVEKARRFFKTNSTSLRHLCVDVGNSTRQIKIDGENGPWTDSWLVPLDLPHLNTVIILGNNFDFIFSLLTIALRSKNLKRICLQRIPYFLENDIRKWEESRQSQGRKLKSETIKEVEIHGLIPASSSLVLAGTLWPSVKQLRIGLDYFDSNVWNPEIRRNCTTKFDSDLDSFPQNIIFDSWTRLEKLELDFRSLLEKGMEKDLELYGNWLQGKLGESQTFQLKHLKNLRCLSLRGHSEIKCGIFTDSLIYNCLRFMKNLQSLRIYGQNSFSEMALEDLQNVLGIGVSILIECPQEIQVQKSTRNFMHIFSSFI